MLYSLDSGGPPQKITTIPHKNDYDIWRSRLTDEEFQAIYDNLYSRISDSEVETSSWMPGSDWTDTVFQPIYEKACRHDHEAAAKFFGIIVWRVFMEHDEAWSFGKYMLNGVPIEGHTYFRITISQ